MDKLNLSLCVITLNEEANIQRCLKSVPFAADIIVLDSGSTDSTKIIAKSLGARVFEEPWRGYGLQKQRAVDLALFDWVLCLDADEELSSELQIEIYNLLKTESSPYFGFSIPRISFHLGRWLAFGGWYPDYQTRLFLKSKFKWSSDSVHESVIGEKIDKLTFNIKHYPFISLADQIETNNRYSSLGAETLQKSGKSIVLWHLIFKPAVKFFELYILKRGFKDGIAGYIIAVGGSYSLFLKYAKLWEMQKLSVK